MILDIFSRYVVGWMLAYRESAELAKRLIEQTIEREKIEPGSLTLHADRGASMTSQPVAFLLAGLGVTKSHSRPYVSNDNPYSESQFKTMKYRPNFPNALVVIRTPIDSAPSFSRGTTTCIITAGWPIHPTKFTTAWRRHDASNGPRSSKKLSGKIPSALSEVCHSRLPYRPRPGLISPSQSFLAPSPEVKNSLIMTTEQKNGSHSCPITNDQPSVKGLG